MSLVTCHRGPLAAAAFVLAPLLHAAEITDLRTQGRTGWMVTNDPEPMLTWKLTVDPDETPVSYEVALADSKQALLDGEGTETRKVALENGPALRFDASALPSRSEQWWRVRARMADGSASEWSDTASFETGLREGDWSAEWIRMPAAAREKNAPRFRKRFPLAKPVAKARLYVAGLGWHESMINGIPVGDEVLQPAQTDYQYRCFYVAHDVTRRLREGENTLGIWLGDGFYNQDQVWGPQGMSYGQPKLKARLEVTHDDGSRTIVTTDESWVCAKSPIVRSNVYAGEQYDARLEDPAWAGPAAGDGNWQPVEKAAAPGGELIAQDLPPCRRIRKVAPVSVQERKPGVWMYDFGANLVGWARLRAEAEAGTRITLRFAEDILSDGSPNYATGGIEHTKAIQTDIYTCKGSGQETWEPRFTYHGFRYVEMTVADGKLRTPPDNATLTAVVVHNDLPVAGRFHCSDPTLNMAFDWAHRTFVGNIQGVPTDCPVRERCGWTGDAHLVVPYSMFRFDAAPLWTKYTGDIVTSARRDTPMLSFGSNMEEREVKPKPAGIPTMVAPGMRFIGEASPDWGSAIVFIPWDVYQFTGDLRPLERHFDSMRQWTLHLESRARDGILSSGLGDWCKPHPLGAIEEPRDYYSQVVPMLSTACFFRCAAITADTARLLGNNEDAERFTKLRETIRAAFLREYYGPEPSMTPDQTIHAIAIDWGILPDSMRDEAASRLAQLVEEAGGHFMTGVFGMPSLWPSLVGHGHQATAWKALQNETHPSFKHLASKGATTFWEVWPGQMDPRDPERPYSRSMSHPFQAAFVQWFYTGLAGIRPDPEKPGFRSILLEPQMIDGLDEVQCSVDSAMGGIESSWKLDGSNFTWNIVIPPGATAKVRIPGRLKGMTPPSDTSSFDNADDAQGAAQRATLPAGRYRLESTLP